MPTLPCRSPTATSASKAKFLPPLTTLAERNTPIVASPKPRSPESKLRSAIAVYLFADRNEPPAAPGGCLKLQSTLGGGIPKGFAPAMILIPIAIKRPRRDALVNRLAGECLTDGDRRRLVAA